MEIFELLVEARRSAFAPSSDYYTGTDATELADEYDVDSLVVSGAMLREKHIKWLQWADFCVTEGNVDELLQQIWGDIEDNNERFFTHRC